MKRGSRPPKGDSSVTQSYISLKEEAKLALSAAAGRVQKARAELANFIAEHGELPASPELRESFDRQRDVLEVEVDSAARFLQKCREDLDELLRRGST
jgi:hypothetical protein